MADQDDLIEKIDKLLVEGRFDDTVRENISAEGASGNIGNQELEAFKPSDSPPSKILGGLYSILKGKVEVDMRSIYVGNVDYSATAEQLQVHFRSCGTIKRVTILCNTFGHPKGFAFIEFADKESVENALAMEGTNFHGRQLKVNKKRTNLPGISTTDRGFRGSRGRSRYARGAFYGFSRSRRGRVFRGSYYMPY